MQLTPTPARRTLRTIIAAVGFLAAAHMARAAAPNPAAVCTTRTEIRADGAIVIHRVCTYTLRSAR